jgi:hypothetical protein
VGIARTKSGTRKMTHQSPPRKLILKKERKKKNMNNTPKLENMPVGHIPPPSSFHQLGIKKMHR